MNNREKFISALFILMLLVVSFFSGEWSKWLQAIVFVFTFLIIFLVSREAGHGTQPYGDWRRWLAHPIVYLTGLIFFMGLSALWSIDWYDSLSEWFLYFAYGLVFYSAVLHFRTIARIRLLAWGVAGIGALAAIIGLIQYGNQSASRLTGLLFNANAVSGLFIIAVPVVFVLLMTAQMRWQRITLGISGALIVVALLLTYSFTAWVSLLIPLGIVIGIYRHRVFTRKKVAAYLVVILVFLIALTGFRYLQSHDIAHALRIYEAVSGSEFQRSFQQRLYFNVSAGDMFLDHPVLGSGLNTFQSGYGQYALTVIEQPRYAHDYYIQTAAELGLAGLVLLALFIYTASRAIIRSAHAYTNAVERNILIGLAAAILASAIHALFDFGWQFPAVFLLFWVITGALIGMRPATSGEEAVTRPYQRFIPLGLILLGLVVLLRGLSVFWGAYSFDAAQLHIERNETLEAFDAYERGLQFDPDPAMLAQYAGNMALAASLVSHDQILSIQDRVMTMVKRMPDDYLGHWTLGRIYFAEKQYEAAVTAYSRAVALNPVFRPDIYYDLAAAYHELGQDDQAIMAARRGLEPYTLHPVTRNPNLPTQLAALNYFLGEMYELRGNSTLATYYYQETLIHQADFTRAQHALDALYLEGY